MIIYDIRGNEAHGVHTVAESENERPSEVRFDYLKSTFHRVVHVDGAFGGLTSHRKVAISLWNSRPAIPRTIVYGVDSDGTIGPETTDKRVERECDGVREVDVTLIMDLSVAKSFRDWLSDKIAGLERTASEIDDE